MDDENTLPLDFDMFEAAFAEYLEERDFQRLSQLFGDFLEDLIKAAYASGYRAAGGLAPESFSHAGWDHAMETLFGPFS